MFYLNILNQFLCSRSYQIYLMILGRCQSKLQMNSNRLVMGCKAIKQNCSVDSQTCFILTQEKSSQQNKQPLGDLRKNFHFSAWCFLRNFLINLGVLLFCITSKQLFLNQFFMRHSIIKFFFSAKSDLYGLFSHLNRFKLMSSLTFSLSSDFCHLLQAI